MGIENYVVKAFPKGLWRLSWLGAIRPEPGSPSEPSIRVFLVKVHERALTANGYNKNTLEESSSPGTIQVQDCWIGVGKLPVLQLGSFWRDGTLCKISSAQSSSIEIRPGNWESFTLSDLHKSGLLMPSMWPLSLRTALPNNHCTGSHVFKFESAGKLYLVPHSVIFQTYYATSSRLAKGITTDRLSNYLNLDRSYLKDKIAYLCLTRDGKRNDAWTLGRLVANEAMNKAAANLYAVLQTASVNRHSMHFQCNLPFSTPAIWTAKVRDYPVTTADDKQISAGLILQIEKCTGNFGFKDVSIEASESKSRDVREEPGLSMNIAGIRHSPSKGSNLQTIHEGQEPSASLNGEEIELDTSRFTFLEGKLPRKHKGTELEGEPSGRRINAGALDVAGVSTGDMTSGQSDLAPINLAEINDSVAPDLTLTGFLDEISALEIKHIRLASRVIREKYTTVSSKWKITFFPPANTKQRNSWPKMEAEGSLTRPRQLVVVEATRSGKYVYFFEAERKPIQNPKGKLQSERFVSISTFVVCDAGRAQMTDAQLLAIAQATSNGRGWPHYENSSPYRAETVSHPKTGKQDHLLLRAFQNLTR